MRDDDLVCLCFSVSKRKIVSFCRRERPRCASQISQCLSAGTGCGWCVPFLEKLHREAAVGRGEPDVPMGQQEYAAQRAAYRVRKKEDARS